MSKPQHYILSLPTDLADFGGDRTYKTVRSVLGADNGGSTELARVQILRIPDFNIGTLDQLVVLSDDLAKYDEQYEAIVHKSAESIRTLLDSGKVHREPQFNVEGKSVDSYIEQFEWDVRKHRVDRNLVEILNGLNQEFFAADAELKDVYQKYNSLKSTLLNLQRKQSGNLLQKSLKNIINMDDFALNSEYMEIILVAVPRLQQKDWLHNYETISEFVIPRSSTLVAEDDEYFLYSVALFKKFKQSFISKCRELKFTPREISIDADKRENGEDNLESITILERQEWENLIRLAYSTFSEAVALWMHLKVLRTFVETKLRYGLVDYVSVVVSPLAKQHKQIRKTLDREFGYLGQPGGQKKSRNLKAIRDLEGEFAGMLLDENYTAYVWYSINWK